MRCKETTHTPCDSIFDEVSDCCSFHVVPNYEECNSDEFLVGNLFMIPDDPLILTREELRRLAQEILDIANEPFDDSECEECEEEGEDDQD